MNNNISKKKLIEVYYQNINGLRTKLVELSHNVARCNYDVIMFTETSLNSNFLNAELGMQNYTIYRKDRNVALTGRERNGGVLIAVLNEYKSRSVQLSSNESEELWVAVEIGSVKKLFCCVYIPPASGANTYSIHCDAVEKAADEFCDYSLCIVGDYNLPKILWTNDLLGSQAVGYTPAAEPVIETFPYLNLRQINDIQNVNNVILDLVFTDIHDDKVECADEALIKCDRHHPALILNLKCDFTASILEYEDEILDFCNCNFNMINDVLLNVNWDSILVSDVDTDLELFCNFINYLIDIYTPKRKIKNRFKFPVWFDIELKTNIIKKKQLIKGIN